jgi:diaminohydroxyphosphoribosylaminopyrimidine deaminase/5-amino-6-(5-phosphoribosylamino)uracil reductase
MDALKDIRFMDTALALAVSQLGRTAPNPSVGCVLVKNGSVIATGATADKGRPHAEAQALESAGDTARGCTAYVTLEPCSFHGQTPPCADGLISAGIARVVIACLDDHPKVSGQGIARLRDAGIKVESGLRQLEAGRLYEGFFHRLKTGVPLAYIDALDTRYDATITTIPNGGAQTQFAKLGQQGMNRVNIAPDHEAIDELLAANLLRIAKTGS